jgi:hypothetical protein
MTTKRNFLQHEASRYMAETNMTPAERREFLTWISYGHSAYDNPWHMADEQGRVMDYISARREVHELSQQQ